MGIALGNQRQCLERMRDFGVGQAVIPVAASRLVHHELRIGWLICIRANSRDSHVRKWRVKAEMQLTAVPHHDAPCSCKVHAQGNRSNFRDSLYGYITKR